MKTTTKLYFAILTLLVSLGGCNTPKPIIIKIGETYDFSKAKFAIPQDTSSLVHTVHDAGTSDKVLLIIQGGPIPYLIKKIGTSITDSEGLPSGFRKFVDEDYTLQMVHQINTLDQYDFQKWVENKELSDDKLSYDDVVEINNENTEIIIRVAEYYKNKGKTIYLLGASYGALLVSHMHSRYSKRIESLFQKTAIFVGRMRVEEEYRKLTQSETMNQYPKWEEGKTLSLELQDENAMKGYFGFLTRITLPVLSRDYITLLADFPEARKSSIWYCTTDRDESIGSLTAEEKAFVKTKFYYSELVTTTPKALGVPHGGWGLDKTLEVCLNFFKNEDDVAIPPAEINVVIPDEIIESGG